MNVGGDMCQKSVTIYIYGNAEKFDLNVLQDNGPTKT